MARSEVQGVVWYLFQQENYTSFTSAGIIGRDDLASVREFLQTAFTDAVTASLTPPVETTPEAESTAEATPDVEVTTEATAEVTPVVEAATEAPPVVEVTEETTPVIEATVEVTAEATP